MVGAFLQQRLPLLDPSLLLRYCHILNFHLRIPSSTEHDQAIPRITASPEYSDSD